MPFLTANSRISVAVLGVVRVLGSDVDLFVAEVEVILPILGLLLELLERLEPRVDRGLKGRGDLRVERRVGVVRLRLLARNELLRELLPEPGFAALGIRLPRPSRGGHVGIAE